MSDLITICVPTYRRPTALLHCLHSCLIQDHRPIEIDVSDNSPNDESRGVVESLSPPEGITLRYWRNEGSTGPVENQKTLFAAARGHRFVWMNDDDVLLPGALSAMAEAFSLAPDVVVSFGLEQIINAAGETLVDTSARWNAEFRQLTEYTGLRRDLLVCAFWQQMPHVGYLVLTEAARKVGIRDRSQVGLAVDTDFAIRLGLEYRGAAHVFIDRPTVRTRLQATTLSRNSEDVCWKLYDAVAAMDNLSREEADARDHLLRRLGPLTLREHSLARRRTAALRILLSCRFWKGRGLVRIAYSVGLIAMPSLAFALRRRVRDDLDWLPVGPSNPLTVAKSIIASE